MNGKLALPVIATALITALVVGGAFFFLGRRPAVDEGRAELERQVTALEEEKAALEQEVADLREENAALKEPVEIRRAPKEGWEQYFPDAETTTLEGESLEDVRQLLGEPPYLVRSTAADPRQNREVWVYGPFPDDPTGLYLFFKGDRLDKARIDEFPGLRESSIWEDEDFWG